MIVGRERELAAIERLVTSSVGGLAVLVFEGEPGIGKSTVWQAGVERAVAGGLTVLSCRPVQAEAKLGFASVADLLAPVVGDLLPDLPAPQRMALEVALLRALPRGPPPDRRAVATAVYTLLKRLAEAGPATVAVDDLQWLDSASAAVLSFALRRLVDVPLRVLLAARMEGGAAPEVLGLDRNAPERVERMRLGPLSLGGVHQVVRTALGLVLPRPTLRRIVQASGGNPLFALELARALAEAGARPGPGEPLPVPETLAALMDRRLGRLPAAAREPLLLAASLAMPERGLVEGALGDHAAAGLDAAERAGIVTVGDGRVVFAHPLMASTVYSSATSAERRAAHERLAAVVPDPEERARHLALATGTPDESVAREVESASRDAELRGALEVAVELAELAYARTPEQPADARCRRALRLSECVFRAGDSERARKLVESVLDEQPEGELRAAALELLARMLHVAGTAAQATQCCQEALAQGGDDRVLLARVHATLACVAWHDFQLARQHARAALDLLEELDDPDPEVLGQALLGFIEAEFYTGRGLPMDVVDRALELERLSPAANVADRISAALGAWLKVDGDFVGARRWLEATHRAAVEEGDDGSLPYVVGHMPQLELWTGNWVEAERLAREHLELAEATAQPDQRRQALFNLAVVHAHQGRVDEARREGEELLADADRVEESWGLSNALSVLGFLELSLGNASEAAAHLARNQALCETMGRTDPLRSFGDFAEALIELGRLDEAEAVIGTLEERSRAVGRVTLLAIAASCRGLLEGERQNLERALAALEEALSLHERRPVAFDRARTQIVLGRVLRRRGERRAAKEALESAIGTFSQLGAALWEARGQAELSRIPLRRAASGELTPTEEQVAQLAAQGKTNREVAQALFMSPKTVEANLSRVYRKLGIASRAQLGATIAQRQAGTATAAKP